eukprot:Hpha_TRINITY_DN33573_c0_g1::TRINITY_DN33573_c0_g1_i1::g.171119::m.171119
MAVPVVIDTDLGDDIDDTWALMQAAVMSGMRLLYVLTAGPAHHDERVRIAAKILNAAGSPCLSIGKGCVGTPGKREYMYQRGWANDADLRAFEQRGGSVAEDGVGELIRLIRASPETITFLAIAPLQNVAEALRRAPDIAGKCRFVGMQGNVVSNPIQGYEGTLVPEYNVRVAPAACRESFAGAWAAPPLVTPLDTCGAFRLRGDAYAQVRDSDAVPSRVCMDAYRYWFARLEPETVKRRQYKSPEEESTVLFDSVAVHMAVSRTHLVFQKRRVRVTEEGMTEDAGEDAGCPELDLALEWSDLPAFTTEFVSLMTSTPSSAPVSKV